MSDNSPIKKIALISGASRGIGKAIAICLAKQGYSLGLLARDEALLAQTATVCEALGGKTIVLPTDITDKPALAASVAQCVNYFGGLSTLIVNHGILLNTPHAEDYDDQWERVIDTNLKASMHLTRLALPFIQQAPSQAPRAIIFIASMAAKGAFAGASAYCASKYGLLGFANCLFEEEREHGIKISTICPGYVNTDMVNTLPQLQPKLMLQPNDVANAVEFLLQSPASCCPVEILLRPQYNPVAQ